MEGLIDTRDEYMEHIQDLLSIPISKRLYGIYNDCFSNKKTLKEFQNELLQIRKWNNNIVADEYKKVVKYTKCSYMHNLIKVIIISTIKIKIYEYKEQFDNIKIKVPNPEDFVHKCYINCSMFSWKNAYLFNRNNIRDAEYQNNLNIIEENIRRIIKKTFRDFIPFEEIFLQIEANLTDNVKQFSDNKSSTSDKDNKSSNDSDDSDDSDDSESEEEEDDEDDEDEDEGDKEDEDEEDEDEDEDEGDKDDKDDEDDEDDEEGEEDEDDEEGEDEGDEKKQEENVIVLNECLEVPEIKRECNIDLKHGYKDEEQDQVYMHTIDKENKEEISNTTTISDMQEKIDEGTYNKKNEEEVYFSSSKNYQEDDNIESTDTYYQSAPANNYMYKKEILEQDDDSVSVVSVASVATAISNVSDIKEIFINNVPKSSKKPSFF
jgi:hypothetical protein